MAFLIRKDFKWQIRLVCFNQTNVFKRLVLLPHIFAYSGSTYSTVHASLYLRVKDKVIFTYSIRLD